MKRWSSFLITFVLIAAFNGPDSRAEETAGIAISPSHQDDYVKITSGNVTYHLLVTGPHTASPTKYDDGELVLDFSMSGCPLQASNQNYIYVYVANRSSKDLTIHWKDLFFYVPDHFYMSGVAQPGPFNPFSPEPGGLVMLNEDNISPNKAECVFLFNSKINFKEGTATQEILPQAEDEAKNMLEKTIEIQINSTLDAKETKRVIPLKVVYVQTLGSQ